ncbi:hypothetical protein AAKU58_000282 [Oxalobacteraceae bacterium GrIS 1.18]
MRKHLLYLTNTELTATMWQNGRLSAGQVFPNDESGWAALSACLASCRQVPVFVLTDLIEEDFHRDTIPHVIGRSHKNLVERRLQQLYRDTPYRHASRQGRAKTGRKDDFMLFNALTNAPLLNTWLNIILEQRVPIAGIFSTALLSTTLFKKLQLGNGPVLLITHQSAGLRQSFFHDGYLRFSRLTKLSGQDGAAVAALANAEISKTRLFLANTRQMQRGELLNIVMLDNQETLAAMQALQLDSDAIATRYIGADEAAAVLGNRRIKTLNVFDNLFLGILGANTPASHYELQEQNHAYTLWKSRIVLYALSGAVLASCLFGSGANLIDGMDAGNRNRDLQQSTQRNARQYQAIVDSMPKTAVKPHDMKSAADLHGLLLKNASSPNALLLLISHALDRLPQLTLNTLSWEVAGPTPPADPANPAPAAGAATTLPAALIGIPVKPGEIVTIKGEVLPFKGNYRAALDAVDQFAAQLKNNPGVQVEIIRMPLDLRPGVPLNGELGNPATALTAEFEIKITRSALSGNQNGNQ